jgi:hypothetical protein
MTTVTLNLTESLVQRAGQAAQVMHRPLEEVLASMLEGVVPNLDDVPLHMRAELVEMTWLDDRKLMAIANEVLADHDQQRLAELSGRDDGLTAAEQQELNLLRERYGELTLRKARAFALLSVRGGKALLEVVRAD